MHEGDEVCGTVLLLHFDLAFEDQRTVVDDGRQDDTEHGALGPGQAAQLGLEGLADGDVPVDRDQNHRPNGNCLGHSCDRPEIHFNVRVEMGLELARVVNGLDRLNDEAGDQVSRVDQGECLEEPVGGVQSVLVVTKDDDGQSIPDESEQTDDANDIDVNDEPEVVVGGVVIADESVGCCVVVAGKIELRNQF